MSILVTGGTGYLGAKLSRLLVQQGEQVVCFDLYPNPSKVAALGDRARVLRGDVTQIEELIAVMKEHSVDRVVHLAYLKTPEAEKMFHAAARVNVMGTDNVYEAARLMGIRRVVISSSVGANGLQSSYGERPVNEEDICYPVTVYGAMKVLNEFMARKYSARYGMEIVSLRIGYAFGHGRERMLSTWQADYASLPAVGKPVRLPCTPQQKFPFIYDEDVAEALALLCQAEKPLHSVYFTGGHTAPATELVDIVREYLPAADITLSDRPGYEAHQYMYMVDNSRMREEFGFAPRPLREGVLAHINEARVAAGLDPIRP